MSSKNIVYAHLVLVYFSFHLKATTVYIGATSAFCQPLNTSTLYVVSPYT